MSTTGSNSEDIKQAGLGDALNELLRKLILDTLLKAVINRLITAIPFLGLPGVNLIVGWALGKIGNLIFVELNRLIQFGLIDLKVGGENNAYKDAVGGLEKALALPDNSPDKERQLNAAKEEFKKRLGNLITFPTA